MAGYSGTPLINKLGIGGDMHIAAVNAPGHYWQLLGELPGGLHIAKSARGRLDLVHAFFTRRADLEARLPVLKKSLAPRGALWISWPKKSSKVVSDVSKDVIRAVALPLGLVDIKVCAVDEVWSGLKLVIRVAERRRAELGPRV